MRRLAWVAVAIVLLSGCADAPSGVALEAMTATVPADGAFEVEIAMQEGDRISYGWTATGELFGDIVRPDVRPGLPQPQSYAKMEATGWFEAGAAGLHKLVWVNEGDAPVELTYNVVGQGRVVD
jgi:hypothetical protein